jgi:hypothetical protein
MTPATANVGRTLNVANGAIVSSTVSGWQADGDGRIAQAG